MLDNFLTHIRIVFILYNFICKILDIAPQKSYNQFIVNIPKNF